jgi:hypothetical protein
MSIVLRKAAAKSYSFAINNGDGVVSGKALRPMMQLRQKSAKKYSECVEASADPQEVQGLPGQVPLRMKSG